MPELEAATQRFVRQHPLAPQQQFISKVAGEAMQHRGGYSQPRRPMQSAPKRACEVRIPYRNRRRPIYCTIELGGRNDVRDQPDEIVTPDPRDPLLTAADGSAEAKFEWRKQIAEHSGFGAKHDSDT